MSPLASHVVLCALACALLFGCTPKPGGACKAGRDTCIDTLTALACVGGKYETIRCGGALGCAATAGAPSCDNSIAAEGDICAAEDDTACSADKQAMLVCKSTRFATLERCRGARGCEVHGDGVTCDVGLAQAGNACRREGNYACSVDHASMLVCKGGTLQISLRCRGARGCQLQEDKVACDDSIADADDACDQEDDTACSVDGKRMLACKAHKYETARTCKTRCEVRGDRVACD